MAINFCISVSTRLATLLGALTISAACFAAATDLPIYSDSLAPGWVDWSWNVTRNLANASPVHSGAKSIAVTMTSPWGALYLHTDALVSTAAPVAGPAITIDVNADRHPISSDIYGINLLSDEALATELRLPVRRWGGNSTSRYNWQNDTTNTGMDWYFENIPNNNPNPAVLPDGSASDRFVEQNVRTGTRTLMTLPTIGWVAKRRTSGHPYDCGFKVSRYGAQQSTDPWDADCGNGVVSNGVNITGNDPTDTSVASNPGFITGWINHLVGKYANAANGGVSYYAFDNEPMIWYSTHRDVHPLAPTYDEIRDRTFQYGAAIKAADPTAKTLGPVEDGWCRYLYSAADNCAPDADYLAHGSVQYVPWYLQQMKSYEQQHGVRILDYLDLHYYPSANGVALSPAGNSATQALRLRSTRSLWDPAYVDESWISETVSDGVAVAMIPRMKQWVTGNYAGTKVAISEYNWGAPESMNGALAQADVLGIFGREGLDLAAFWGDVLATQPLSFAFRMYRNYDGQGHGFGDTAVRSVSVDQSALAVYAAQRSAEGVLTLMLINKSANALTSAISLAGFNAQPNAAVYRYSPANLAAIEHAPDQAITASGFTATVPASSITLFVIASASTRLVNLSTRGQVQTGNNVMIGGFIIQGSTPKKVLIRAVGPNLANYGVSGVLADPMLELHRSSDNSIIASNDDWGSASNAAEIQASTFAPVNSKESAILATLDPGAYTAIVTGKNAGTGVGIVEVYDIDHPEILLVNISTRGQVLTGDNVMIGGFIIQGTSNQTVLIRAVGPNLANFGVTGVLADPMLELHRSSDNSIIASNDNWGTASNAAAIAATGLAPVSPLESAILITLQPGAYTAIVSGAGGGTGVGIVEVFAQ